VLAQLQVSVKLVVALKGPVDALPFVDCAPDQPSEAVQLVAFVELQVSVEESPAVIACGFAVSSTVVTAGPTATSTL
jgi:hypothetical protein